MTTELGTAIREALHADEIGAADLRLPVLRTMTARPARPWLAPLTAALVVVALAVGVSVVVANRTNSTSAGAPATGHAMAGVVGYRWQVTRIADVKGSVSVPAPLHASITFDRTQVYGDDTVNDLAASYRATRDGYELRGGASTSQVGYGATDPVRVRTISAIDALFNTSMALNAGSVDVEVRLAGDVLTLHDGSITVIARRAGRHPDAAAATTSATSTTNTAFRYLGPVPHTETLAGGSLLLEPPTGDRPKLTPAQAFSMLCGQSSLSCVGSGTVRILLARLTTPNSGHARPDGSTEPGVNRVLSYVISQPGATCYPSGPAGSDHRPVQCTETDVIDATTGRAIAGQYYGS